MPSKLAGRGGTLISIPLLGDSTHMHTQTDTHEETWVSGLVDELVGGSIKHRIINKHRKRY